MTLFSNLPDSALKRAVALVEDALRALGLEPSFTRRPSSGQVLTQYMLQRGTVNVYVALHKSARPDDEGTLRVFAPVVILDPSIDEKALFRRLLELNGSEALGAPFAILYDEIVVISERSVQDLDPSEVDAMIRTVGRVADEYDDALAREFGLTCVRNTRI